MFLPQAKEVTGHQLSQDFSSLEDKIDTPNLSDWNCSTETAVSYPFLSPILIIQSVLPYLPEMI